ncbi:MAG: LytTR family DNA-binding domain-containing protein [Lachnospiraceae bacterium]|nr:LytTR family DNA-binding domain-containing protein [Lachnospiraceae bacterium]
MKIVICDDCVEDLQNIENLLKKYEKAAPGAGFVVEKYTDAALLYDRILEGEQADLYLLDMIMSDRTGIDIGSLIRKSGGSGVIVYITASDDYALEAYGVHAARYLLKPVSEESFFEALDAAQVSASMPKRLVFAVKTKAGTVSVPCSKIEYIENYSRTLNVCMEDGQIIRSIFIRKSFDDEIREIAADRSFLQVHKSFLINMEHVKKLEHREVVMESGRRIPVSKTRFAEVKRAYLLYISASY